ncbi:3242_t:CDS:2 [Dentiscutata heterogama]|uniref:3242_t:CDS:1 n=1 Tax=Dentiscutata heterogama TaxID=1316150 RepID=A0ACA9MJM6_9GLOM|nr:3242_t:CDS:2 [Dentiscutata heterogama]
MNSDSNEKFIIMTKQFFLFVLVLLITTPYTLAIPYDRRSFLKNQGPTIYYEDPIEKITSAEAAQVNQLEITALNADEAAASADNEAFTAFITRRKFIPE